MQFLYFYRVFNGHILKPVAGSLLPVAGYYYLCVPKIF